MKKTRKRSRKKKGVSGGRLARRGFVRTMIGHKLGEAEEADEGYYRSMGGAKKSKSRKRSRKKRGGRRLNLKSAREHALIKRHSAMAAGDMVWSGNHPF